MQTTALFPKSRPDATEVARLIDSNKSLITRPGAAVPIARDGAELAALAGLNVREVDVTPAMAGHWLKNNFVNRPLREDVVKAYARDMLTGQWVLTHQGIAFNDRDELIDGQHRLNAIVMASVTVRMIVTFGLKSKVDGREMTTMDCVDRGATRSVGDQLKIQHGFDQGGVIAAICARLGALCFGEKTRRLSVGQTLEIYREFEHAVVYVIEHRSKHHGLRQTGILSGFAFALATETGYWQRHTLMSGWLEEFMTGERLDGKSPVGLLRDFATSDDAKLFTRSMSQGLAELTLQAIWLQKGGARPAKLEMGTDGAEHFRQLQAERVKKVAGIFQLPGKTEARAEDGGSKRAKGEMPSAVAPTAAREGACAPRADMPAAQRPALEKIIGVAERHFGIDRRILMNRRAVEDTIVSSRNCMLRCMEELGHGKADIGAATDFEINALTGILSTFAGELKVNQRFARKYAAFRGKF